MRVENGTRAIDDPPVHLPRHPARPLPRVRDALTQNASLHTGLRRLRRELEYAGSKAHAATAGLAAVKAALTSATPIPAS